MVWEKKKKQSSFNRITYLSHLTVSQNKSKIWLEMDKRFDDGKPFSACPWLLSGSCYHCGSIQSAWHTHANTHKVHLSESCLCQFHCRRVWHFCECIYTTEFNQVQYIDSSQMSDAAIYKAPTKELTNMKCVNWASVRNNCFPLLVTLFLYFDSLSQVHTCTKAPPTSLVLLPVYSERLLIMFASGWSGLEAITKPH